AQKSLTIEGAIGNIPDGTVIYLVPLSDTENWRDSAVTRHQLFRFKRTITQPSAYSIRIGRDYAPGKWQDVYVDAGHLGIKANYDFSAASTYGSRWAIEFNDYLQSLSGGYLRSQMIQTEKKIEAAGQVRDSSRLRALF